MTKPGVPQKFHFTDALSNHVLLVTRGRAMAEALKGTEGEVSSIAANDSGSDMTGADTPDASSSASDDIQTKTVCLKINDTEGKKSGNRNLCKKKIVSILKTPAEDSDAGYRADINDDYSEADGLVKCCKKVLGKKAKTTAPSDDSTVASTDATPTEPSSDSESVVPVESAGDTTSDGESSKAESGEASADNQSQGDNTSNEQNEATQTSTDAAINEQSEGTQTATDASINEQSEATPTATDASINEQSEGTQTADGVTASEAEESSKPASSAAGDGWTPSKDALLRSMKEGGETWAIITSALRENKKSCQLRWKELSANDGGNNKTKPCEDTDNAKEPEVVVIDGAAATTPAADSNVAPGDTTANEADNEADNVKSKKYKKKGKLSPEVKKRMSKANRAKQAEAREAAEVESSASSVAGGRNRLKSRLKTWIGVHGPYYAAAAKSAADPGKSTGWTAEDCAVLGTLERKRHVERWLELQADFFNATGRMVSVDTLKAKLGEN